MHRKGLGIILSLALLAISAIPAAAASGESGGPCANILAQGDRGATVGTTATYAEQTAGSGFRAGVRIELAAPSCERYTYTLVVTDQIGGTDQTVATASTAGNGSSLLELNVAYDALDGDVCVYVYSSVERAGTEKLLDRAPDEGCVDVDKGATSGGAGGNRMG